MKFALCLLFIFLVVLMSFGMVNLIAHLRPFPDGEIPAVITMILFACAAAFTLKTITEMR